MHKLFTVCKEQVRSPYTEHAAIGLPNPTHLEGAVRFDQAQDQQVVTTRSRMFCPFYSFIYSFVCSFIPTNEHSFIHIHSFLRRFNHSFAYSLVIKMSLWPTKAIDLCAQRRLRLASASTQSDQSRHCLHEEILGS